MQIRESAEDYLEAILVLSKKAAEFVLLILRLCSGYPSQVSAMQ